MVNNNENSFKDEESFKLVNFSGINLVKKDYNLLIEFYQKAGLKPGDSLITKNIIFRALENRINYFTE